MKRELKYGKRIHRGSLKDSMTTKTEIDYTQFLEEIDNYKFYGVDERVKQILFIAKNIKTKYTWLYIQYK